MADIASGEATLAAKVASSASAGVAWGSFVTMLLLVPAAFTAIFSPFAKKANIAISEKISTINVARSAKASGKKESRSEKQYRQRMEELNRQREETELQERLANLQRKRSPRASSQSSRVI